MTRVDTENQNPPEAAREAPGTDPATTPIIEVRHLHRVFGRLHAVKGISFDILPGQVVGFIGANGAGKTTTMRMMATLELPTRGQIRICGYDVVEYPNEVRKRIGWMPDHYGTYDNVTVEEYLDFFARAYGYKGRERQERVQEVMDFADLEGIKERLMDKLSKGMAQRLCLGRTLLHDPEVLILDEPAAGLDPKARIELKNLIRLLAEEGKTIFISSHILSELGEMCDTLLFIDQGKIVHHGSQESLLHEQSDTVMVDVQVSGDPQKLKDWIDLNPGLEYVAEIRRGARVAVELPAARRDEAMVGAEDEDARSQRLEEGQREYLAYQLKKMVTDGVPVIDFHRQQRRLEDAFVDMLSRVAEQSEDPGAARAARILSEQEGAVAQAAQPGSGRQEEKPK
jgi:ABC-2 type transport system ATP-binding protein